MRVLNFKVSAQVIEPEGDFSNLVPGTSNYLIARFKFSEDWDRCAKVASFWRYREEYAVIIRNNECVIPAEALTGPYFKVQVTGRCGDSTIPTNKLKVRQGGDEHVYG